MFVYFKELSQPVAWQDFAAGRSGCGGAADAEEVGTSTDCGRGSAGHCGDRSFISAVAWRPRSSMLLASNSLGAVKLLQLTGSAAEGDRA